MEPQAKSHTQTEHSPAEQTSTQEEGEVPTSPSRLILTPTPPPHLHRFTSQTTSPLLPPSGSAFKLNHSSTLTQLTASLAWAPPPFQPETSSPSMEERRPSRLQSTVLLLMFFLPLPHQSS